METELFLPEELSADTVIPAVEVSCTNVGLKQTLRTTLKKYPGSTHWHYKSQGHKGILELTWWPSLSETRPHRLWMSVHGNRTADWIFSTAPKLKHYIESQLGSGDFTQP